MSKRITLTQDQLAAMIADGIKRAQGGKSAEPEKPKRTLSFSRYVNNTKTPATAADFQAALATGVDAGSVYAHASTAMRAVSAAAMREILTALGAALS